MTFAKATFYNGLLAVVAGFVSSIAADLCGWGPLAPFMIAIPVLFLAGITTFLFWEENQGSDLSSSFTFKTTATKSLQIIFAPKDKTLLHVSGKKKFIFSLEITLKNKLSLNLIILCFLFQLGMVQMLFESAVYTFVIAWSPLLLPLHFSLGLVFAAFMLSIMLGSIIYSSMISSNYCSPEKMLSSSMRMATMSMMVVAVLTISDTTQLTTQICYIALLIFEVSVGIYFPAWGYLAGRAVPEDLRASVVSWFRFV